jgi:hypothetical protein
MLGHCWPFLISFSQNSLQKPLSVPYSLPFAIFSCIGNLLSISSIARDKIHVFWLLLSKCHPHAKLEHSVLVDENLQCYRYFVGQSSEFCRHNPLCCFSTGVYCSKRIFRYDSIRILLDRSSYNPIRRLKYNRPISRLLINKPETRYGELFITSHALKMNLYTNCK